MLTAEIDLVSSSLVWSPDGRRIAFHCYENPQRRDICVIDVLTHTWKNLTHHPADDWDPHWSPDGMNLVFVSDWDGNREIYLLHLATGQLENLSRHPATDWSPRWSPFGDRIAFNSERDGDREIYTMDAHGQHIFRLTYSPGYDGGIEWLP